MPSFLEEMLDAKREEVAARMRARPLEALLDREPPGLRDFAAALSREGISAIAEIKRRSPSKGVLRADLDPAELASAYATHGAGCLSVLTDREFFGGSDQDLIAARSATELPALRKDFVIDPYQVHETRCLGADAVLLIVRILAPSRLTELLGLATDLGLTALVEVHAEAELRRAVDAGASVIGVNAHDLETFRVDLDAAQRLRASIPDDRLAVAENGIRTPGHVSRLRRQGFDAFLVGETLMRADDPGAELERLLGPATGEAP
jgi:indole-3-glycerol phosphate synthase